MKNNIKIALFLLVLFVSACSDLTHDHSTHGSDTTKESHENEKSGELYTCPMHPQIVQDKAGSCPICGMDLVIQKSDKKTTEDSDNKNIIAIDPVTVQNMGIRIDSVKKGTISRHIRSYGRVEIPDDQIGVVNLRYSGWVEKIWVDKIGDFVKKGEKLFAIYSPEIYAAEKEYIMALKNYSEGSDIIKSAKERLILWNIPLWIINKIEEEREPIKRITVTAPSSGFVHHKSIVKGSRVTKGTDLYTIYDLKKVWIKSEVYDSDISWIDKNESVTVRFTSPGQKDINAKISYIYPTLNRKSQTITIRIELDNKKRTIKPGMVATVIIHADKKEKQLIIPTESIIDSGNKKIVFVSEKLGRYEAREVKTGIVGDNDVTEITDGLIEGETIVLSGQFLLDSESQLKEAVEKFLDSKLQSHH